MHPLRTPKNLVIAGLGAAVIGLGAVVTLDHTVGATAALPQSAALTASTAPTHAGPGGTFGRFGARFGPGFGESPQALFGFFTKDTGLTAAEVIADVRAGKTLAQIAGANTAKVEGDALATVKAMLDRVAAKGAITSSQEARLLDDARDAISVLMNAKIAALFPSAG